MSSRSFLLAALLYLLGTFPLAFFWHLVAFRGLYAELGYFRGGEPIVPLGFLTILLQGLLLSYAYPRFSRGERPILEGWRFGLLMGAFLWTSQVVAAAAKHHAPPVAAWFGIETAYFAVQFSLVGAAIGWAYGKRPHPHSERAEERGHALSKRARG